MLYIIYSEQEILDCYGAGCYTGGNSLLAYYQLIKTKGNLYTSSSYPYKSGAVSGSPNILFMSDCVCVFFFLIMI